MSENIKTEIISWIKTIGSAIILALFITTFIIVNARVPSGSMENNIMTNDRIIANRLSYLFSEPKRFDVVVFKYPDDEKVLFVKRVIGMPGETVEIIDGRVYIDGSDEPLPDEIYLKEKAVGDFGPFEVPEGHYFMMGDNRNESKDSRKWENKYLAKDKILGKVIFKYYKGFGLIK